METQEFENRRFMVFNVSEVGQIDFSQVLETSAETVRISVDGSKTFVKWDGVVPTCLAGLTTSEGPYGYDEMIALLLTPAWTDPSLII